MVPFSKIFKPSFSFIF